MKKIGIAILALLVLAVATLVLFQERIGAALFERAADRGASVDTLAGLPDGLHLGLCGTGSPLPNPQRAGPCNVVIAGDRVFVVDIGEGGNRNIALMGINAGKIEALLLTHFHSDHIDGLGPLMLFHWTRGASTSPLAVYGPAGVDKVIEGFDAAYAQDNTYRTAHHGEEIAPTSGGGGEARPFDMAGDTAVVIDDGGLKVTAFAVDHFPVQADNFK